MYALYSLLTAAGMLLLSPYFLLRGLIQGKYLGNIPERLGWRFPPELRAGNPPVRREKSIWIHAVSVGEVLAVLPLAQQLKKRFPQRAWSFPPQRSRGRRLRASGCRLPTRFSIFPWTGAAPSGVLSAPSRAAS